MAEAPDLQARSTNQPRHARLRVATGANRLTPDQRVALGQDLYATWIAAQTAREPMDENLAAWSALYEMEVDEVSDPWVGAANLVPPIIPAELDAMKSYIAQQVFVPRLVLVSAADGDPETARLAPTYEKYLNSELRRIRSDGKTPLDHFKTVLHLGLRDGGGPCDVLFSERVEPKLIATDEPKIVDDNIVLDDETQEPVTERVVTRVEETISEVSFIPRLLKEWYLVPDESTSIQSALGQPSVVWFTEEMMREKIAAGLFDEEAVEKVLQRHNTGTSDVASDPGGSWDKDAGGQIEIGQAQGSLTSEFFANRGPFRLIRMFSCQFDLNKDGIVEKNVFWHHPDYPLLVGHAEYEYVSGEWPTFMFAPFPRPDRPYGYSLVERLADIVADAAAGRNQRRNYIDLATLPLLLEKDGDQIRDKNRAFYPGARWSVEDTEKSIKWFTVPPLPPDSFADESRLDVYVSKLTGQNAPAVGAQSSGRRSATESRQQQLAQTVRANDVAMEFRSFLRASVQFWHKLNKQFLGAQNKSATTMVPQELTPQGQKPGPLTIDPAVFMRNFNIDIAGLADPVDAPSRRTELLSAMGVVFEAFPWIAADDELSYAWAEQFVDTFAWASTERFIGTAQQALERKKAKAEMMQQAAEQQQALGAQAPGGTNGRPAQPAGAGQP